LWQVFACIYEDSDRADWTTVPSSGFRPFLKDFKMHTSKFQFQRFAVLVLAAAAVVGTGGSALAQDKVQSKTQDSIYGSQLMTDAERREHRLRMRSLKTNQEREAYQLEHHKVMTERAREKGVTLPEVPPAAGGGMGAGPRPGPAGGGMGAGSPGQK
jgi:hypothetical protein